MNELCSCIKVDAHVVGGGVMGFDAQVRDSHSRVKVIASPGAVSTVQHMSEVLSPKPCTILCEIPEVGRKIWILIGHSYLCWMIIC